MRKSEVEHTRPDSPDPGFRVLSLLTGILLVLLLTAFPHVAMDRWGAADHVAALLLLWSMSAGLVSGVGFVPYRWLPRMLLSSPACLLALVLALLRVASH
jgi:predicted membrane protein